jgi:hypothetical protein
MRAVRTSRTARAVAGEAAGCVGVSTLPSVARRACTTRASGRCGGAAVAAAVGLARRTALASAAAGASRRPGIPTRVVVHVVDVVAVARVGPCAAIRVRPRRTAVSADTTSCVEHDPKDISRGTPVPTEGAGRGAVCDGDPAAATVAQDDVMQES